MTLNKYLHGESDKEKEAYQKGFMDGMRAAKVDSGFYECDCTEALIYHDPYHEKTFCVKSVCMDCGGIHKGNELCPARDERDYN